MSKNKTENAVIKYLILSHLSKKLLGVKRCENSNDIFLMQGPDWAKTEGELFWLFAMALPAMQLVFMPCLSPFLALHIHFVYLVTPLTCSPLPTKLISQHLGCSALIPVWQHCAHCVQLGLCKVHAYVSLISKTKLVLFHLFHLISYLNLLFWG